MVAWSQGMRHPPFGAVETASVLGVLVILGQVRKGQASRDRGSEGRQRQHERTPIARSRQSIVTEPTDCATPLRVRVPRL